MITHNRDLDEWSPQGPVTELSDPHSWGLLAQRSLGRLGLSVNNQPEIFPVNYYADGQRILFRTAEGTKLTDLVANGSVVFEVDAEGDDRSWSVIAKGRARILTEAAEISAADRSPLPEWIPTLACVYVEIRPTDVQGRSYRHRVAAERVAH
jgi:nitroimidazol reductase NimA-like FMN-containing flavoprotein (pyridoxamine 5'-phosphate oxidase superfamily)